MELGLKGKAAIVAASSKGLGKICALGLAGGVSILVLWAFGFAAPAHAGDSVKSSAATPGESSSRRPARG
jgi:hypothetical protein